MSITKKGVISMRQQLQRIDGELKATDVKTEKSRPSTNVPKSMVEELKRHKSAQAKSRLESPVWHQTDFVFTSTVGTPLDPRNVAKGFTSACGRAKIGKWHPHELRHTAASLMPANGIPLQVESDIFGHASIRLTSDVYGHVLAPQRQEAAEVMARFYAAHG
jgi:integrase